MPRFLTYVGHHEFAIETERPITHLLTGCRIEASERPPEELFERYSRSKAAGPKRAKHEDKLTVLELARLARYQKGQLNGRYTRKPLDWFESEAAAVEAQASWTTHEDFRVIPIAAKIG